MKSCPPSSKIYSYQTEEGKASYDSRLCFQIPENGYTSRDLDSQHKFILYKSPIPKTYLTRALLTENTCDQRKLNVTLDKLRSRRDQQMNARDRKISAFAQLQQQKYHQQQHAVKLPRLTKRKRRPPENDQRIESRFVTRLPTIGVEDGTKPLLLKANTIL